MSQRLAYATGIAAAMNANTEIQTAARFII